jgi:hypothetical protein
MMGSMVLAGCLHSGTVERIADEEAFELSATEEWRNNTVYADTEYRCDDDSTIALFFVNDGGDDCADGSDENPNGSRADFTCADGSAVQFNQTNDRSSDCADGSDEVATTQIYTITGEIGSDQKDGVSLSQVELRVSRGADDTTTRLVAETGLVAASGLGGAGVTYNDNDNDGLLSPGDTYQIETTTDTAGLNVVFFDLEAGAEAVYDREPTALRGKCECIPLQGWSIVPDPANAPPPPLVNTCVTCTSSADCSYGYCKLVRNGNPNLFKDDQGCRWVNTYVIGKDVREPADVQAVE